MDIGGGPAERPTGRENSGDVFNSQRTKTIGLLVGVLVLFFVGLVALSYV